MRPIFEVFTDNVPYIGPFGHGTRMKFIANHLVAILNVATAESVTFARKMGMDVAKVQALVAQSSVIGTGVYRLRGGFMVKRRYRPATMKVEVWQKDMQVIGDMARMVDAPCRYSRPASRSITPRCRVAWRRPIPRRCARSSTRWRD